MSSDFIQIVTETFLWCALLPFIFPDHPNACSNASVGCPSRLKERSGDLPKIALVSTIPQLLHAPPRDIILHQSFSHLLTGCPHKFAWRPLEPYEILIFYSLSGGLVQVPSLRQQKTGSHCKKVKLMEYWTVANVMMALAHICKVEWEHVTWKSFCNMGYRVTWLLGKLNYSLTQSIPTTKHSYC